jgi:hypothetical protein
MGYHGISMLKAKVFSDFAGNAHIRAISRSGAAAKLPAICCSNAVWNLWLKHVK